MRWPSSRFLKRPPEWKGAIFIAEERAAKEGRIAVGNGALDIAILGTAAHTRLPRSISARRSERKSLPSMEREARSISTTLNEISQASQERVDNEACDRTYFDEISRNIRGAKHW